MQENENKKSSNTAIWGCIGVVSAALITGFFGVLAVAFPTLVSLFNPTATPATVSLSGISGLTETMESQDATALPVVPAVPSATSTALVYAPLPSDYISIKGYVGIVNSGGITGDMTYSHLVTGEIKYERIEADDDIGKVELVCAGKQTKDIKNSFFLIPQPQGSVFPNYASQEIEVPANCRIDFFVIDTAGGQTGITIRSVAVP